MEELSERLRPYPKEGRWDEMEASISDDVLELFATVGTYDKIGRKIMERYEELTDTLSLFVRTDTEPGPLDEILQDIQRIPPSRPMPRNGDPHTEAVSLDSRSG
jgi:hypothetical protein